MLSSSSSQLRNWTFSSLSEVNQLRQEANEHAREKYRNRTGVSLEDSVANCLSVGEELLLIRHYQHILEQLCDKTEPPIPRHTRVVAVTYVRRFYLHHSVIDFYPREVMLTAIWIAMKTEEFNLSLVEFGRCIPRNATKYIEIIRSSELFLIESLNYDLLVHVPTRAIDGMVAEWRAYLAEKSSSRNSNDSERSDDDESMQDDSHELLNERVCANAVELVYRSVHTDAMFIFTPSQIALGLLQSAIENSGDGFLRARFADFVRVRMCEGRRDIYDKLMAKAVQLVSLVKADRIVMTNESAVVEEKLEKCRNPEYNFDSDVYKAKKREWTQRYEKL